MSRVDDTRQDGTGCVVAGTIAMSLMTLLILAVPFLFVLSSTRHGGQAGFLVKAWLLMIGLPLAGGVLASVIGSTRDLPASRRILRFCTGAFAGSLIFLALAAAFYLSAFTIADF